LSAVLASLFIESIYLTAVLHKGVFK